MATNRFFYLPWLAHPTIAAAVGTTTRWAESPNYNNPYNANNYYWRMNQGRFGSAGPPQRGNEFHEVLDTTPMTVYAVTQNTAQVPLSESTMDYVSPLSNQNLDYPMQPSYRYWTGAELRTAAYFQTTMNDPSPDTVLDDRGPIETIRFRVPCAKSVYQLNGVTSITGAQFVCAGYQPYQSTYPLWIRNSLGSQHTYVPQTTPTGFGPFNTCAFSASLHPYCIYIVRPSTGAIVGWLAYDLFGTANGAVNNPQNGATELPTAITDITRDQGAYNYGQYSDVNGIQTGDLLVWEWWMFATGGVWSLSDAQVARPKVVNWKAHIRTHWGGGTVGQPLTFDGGTGLPNWAPSHRAETSVPITGFDPVYISSIRTTNISASLGSASDSTELTVVN